MTSSSSASKTTNSVYVQGFPPDEITEELVFNEFSRVGMIKKDQHKPKIKLYLDKESGKPKGDALVTFVVPDSVFLAIQRFDGVEWKPGFSLAVSEAKFQPNSQSSSARVDDRHQRVKKVRHMQERALLSWNDEEVVPKESALLIVVLKGMFIPTPSDEELVELESDLIEGLGGILHSGEEIKKITVFKSHPEGVIVIRFRDAKTAQECVELMNGRWFDGRKIVAELWNGVTEFGSKVNAETKSKEDEQRLEDFEKFIGAE